MALEYLDSPYRVDDVEPNLQQAEQRLVNLSPSDAAPLKEQIADIRDKLDNMVSPADARQVSAAEGKLRQARDFIDTNRGQLTQSGKDHVEELFGGAVQFLNQILDARKADKLKAPVLAEIERIRLQYGTNTVAAPPVAIPKAATNVAPGPNYSNAKGKVFWANDYFASPGRMDQVEPELAQAEQLLSGDESHEADALRNEISALREKLADVISPQDEAYVRAAQRDVQSVRDYMDRQRDFLDRGTTKQDLDQQLQKIIDQGLSKITNPRKGDQLKAPILAEIALIRSQLGLIVPRQVYPPPSQPTQPQTQYPTRSVPQYALLANTNALSYDDQDRMNRAKRSIGQARSNIESRRTEGVENLFFDATNVMAPVNPAYKDPLVAEIEQLRKDLEATRLSESTRIITDDLNRKLDSIKDDLEDDYRLQYSVRTFKQRFERDDVRQTLSPNMQRDYEKRLADLLALGNARVKAVILSRVNPALKELQERLATNPFAGLRQYETDTVDGEFWTLRKQVDQQLQKLPEEDPDRLRLYEELKGTDATWQGYLDELEKAEIYEEVKRRWYIVLVDDIKGWEEESVDPGAQPLQEPNMDQTRLGIHRINYYLHKDTSVQQTRDENPGDAFIAKIDGEAKDLFQAVGNKMASAFYQIIDAAEKMETPLNDRYTLEKPSYLVTSARGTFQDTEWLEPVVSRIQKLDQRWKDEIEAVRDGRKNLGEKLSAEAVQKWPSVVAGIPVVSSFDPSSAKPGDSVHLGGVYNRAGWDFDGNQYGFSMRFNGIPLGGIYEAYINKALDHAAYELKLTIDDHKQWDVVGVVLGPGSIKERTKRTIRRGMYTEEIEEWLPIDCLRLRIIALRAGPVLVGPQT